mgnify:CR=1 FL=1
MPTYTYRCSKCEHAFDVFHRMSEDPRVQCERCSARCTRMIGAGAGIIFKGTGFYETDYKRKDSGPKEEKGSKEEKGTTAEKGAKEETRATQGKETKTESAAEKPPAKKDGSANATSN